MNDGLVIALKLLAVVALVLANGFFVASEFALVAIRRSRVEEMVATGQLGAKAVQRAVRNLDHSIAATQLGITLASLALGWLGEPTLGGLLEGVLGHAPGGHTLAVIIAFSIITTLHIVLGELTPKSIALQYPERTSLVIANPLGIFDVVFRPFIVVLNGTGRVMVRALGLHAPSGHELIHSAAELKLLVEASGKAGALEESERAIIGRAFDFADFEAHEVMVPRTEVVFVAAETPGREVLRIAQEAGYSRYPVFDGTLDHISGMVHVKDLLRSVLDGRIDTVQARDLVREVLYVPATLGMDSVLEQMRRRNIRMAIVVDEFGGTAGVVTMENVVERLVGALRDEFEQAEQEIRRVDDNTVDLSGLTLITDVNALWGLELDTSDFDTIGGYVFGALGRLPEPGDRVPAGSWDLVVDRMDGRRVDRLRLVRSGAAEDVSGSEDAILRNGA